MIDSHCHLADEAFAGDLEAVVTRAREVGVEAALCILSADEPDELARVPAVSAAWPEVRFAAAIHPHRVGEYACRVPEAVDVVRSAARQCEAVAIGEIGLDYHYDHAPREVQREVFAAQVALAVETDRPVIIHTREATTDTVAVLRDAGQGRARGVIHCFTGSVDEARQALDLGFFISLAGILTFPKADALRNVGRFVPSDRLLIETDAPFLAPVPYRGKRNEPAWVAKTLDLLASVRGLPADSLERDLGSNFSRFLAPTAVLS